MKRFTSHFSPFALFFFVVTTLNTTLFAMKRTIGTGSSCADAILRFCELSDDLSWRLLSPCRKSDLTLVCKPWAKFFSFSNWKTILCTQPEMLTRHPTDCKRICYRLIKEKDVDTMKTLLAADAQVKKHLEKLLNDFHFLFIRSRLSPEMRKQIESYLKIEPLGYSKKGNEPGWDAQHELQVDPPLETFVDHILYNNIEGMRIYLTQYDMKEQLDVLALAMDVVARYVSIPMLEVLKPILTEPIVLDGDYEQAAEDWLVAKAAVKSNGHRVEIVAHLLSGGASLEYDWDEESSLVGAVVLAHEKNDYSLLELCVYYGLDLNPDPVNDDRKIRYAEVADNFSLDEENVSALGWAIMNNNPSLVHNLLHLGADPAKEANLFQMAQKLGNREIIQALRFASMTKKKD